MTQVGPEDLELDGGGHVARLPEDAHHVAVDVQSSSVLAGPSQGSAHHGVEAVTVDPTVGAEQGQGQGGVEGDVSVTPRQLGEISPFASRADSNAARWGSTAITTATSSRRRAERR